VSVLDREGSVLAEAASIDLSVSPRSYHEKQLIISNVLFSEPRITVAYGPDGVWNIGRLLKEVQERKHLDPPSQTKPVIFEQFAFQNAMITLEAVPKLGMRRGLSLIGTGKAIPRAGGAGFDFDFQGHFSSSPPLGACTLHGTVAETIEIRAAGKVPASFFAVWVPDLEKTSGETEVVGKFSMEKGKPPVWFTEGQVSDLAFAGEKEASIKEFGATVRSGTPLKFKLWVESAKNAARCDVVVSSPATHSAEIQLKADRFDLEEVLKVAGRFHGSKAGRVPWIFHGSARAREGSMGPFHFANFSSSVSLDRNGKWWFEKMNCDALGGTVMGKLQAGVGLPIAFEGEARRIRAEKFLGMWQSTASIEGEALLQGKISGPAESDFLERSEGRIYMKVQNGSLRNVPAFLKILSAVNIKSVFETKLGSAGVKHFAFDVLSGEFGLSGGKVASNNLEMESRTLSLSAQGAADLVKEELDAKVSLQVLTFVDEVLNHLPFVHNFVNKKGILPLWAGVKGDWQKPEVSVYKLGRPQE
jgi:hypothetical protein